MYIRKSLLNVLLLLYLFTFLHFILSALHVVKATTIDNTECDKSVRADPNTDTHKFRAGSFELLEY